MHLGKQQLYPALSNVYSPQFRYLKKLDWYIVKKFIGTFFFCVMILAIIACVIDYSVKLTDFVKNHAPVLLILNYFKDFIPHISALLYPLFIFIACIFFTSKLAYKSEIIAMLATGMSFNRFLRPYIIGALLLGGLALLTNHFIVPMANKERFRFEAKYVKEQVRSSDNDVHLQLSENLLVYMQTFDYSANRGTRFTAERIKGTVLKEKIMAESVLYDSVKKEWKLQSVTVRTNDSLKEQLKALPELTEKFPFTPKDLKKDIEGQGALTTPELTRYIEKQKLHGNANLNIYYIEKYRRTSQPFAGLILTIIGVSIASRRIRGGSGLHLAIGIVIAAIYELAIQFTSTLSTNADLSPLLSVWIPNILFAPVAYILYRRQVK